MRRAWLVACALVGCGDGPGASDATLTSVDITDTRSDDATTDDTTAPDTTEGDALEVDAPEVDALEVDVLTCAEPELEPAPLATDLTTLAPTEPGHVRAVWLSPSDRPLAPGLHARLEAWLDLASSFFSSELARWTGSARTFTPQRDADGRWDVVFLRGEHDLAFYHAHDNSPDAGGQALAEVFQRLPSEFHRDAIILYFYDTAVVVGAGLEHSGQAGSAAPWQGEHAGYALIGAHVLGVGFDTVRVDADRQACVFDDTRASGLEDYDAEGAWRALDRGEWASTYLGASIHELGHAFGLDHVFDDADEDGVDDNLMGNGFRRFGSRFTSRLPQPPTLLGPTSAAALAAHPFLTAVAPSPEP